MSKTLISNQASSGGFDVDDVDADVAHRVTYRPAGVADSADEAVRRR